MMRSLYTAAAGMKVNQTYVDNISNNLSNINTVGFKKSSLQFEDLIYQTMQEPGGETAEGVTAPLGIQIGLGSRVAATDRDFSQGSLDETGNSTDAAIEGDGFFQIRLPNGETAYTRAGNFSLSSDGYLCTSQGYILEPGIVIPDDADDMYIDEDGKVMATLTEDEEAEELGQIELARFINPAGLSAQGGNLYLQTEASGEPILGTPGDDNFGSIKNQYLEASNVDMVDEMVGMIIAQRAYEISSKSITTSDDMLQTATSLKT
ncbi:MAG TPA: flagellar basal-body rod protein FlgG [Fibrobacteraceae bacterium]|nr:flagellar basal-body rod protein FlgG [Fibrobacteraceae bacterium]